MTSPMYITEIAPARMRGRLVSLNQLTIVSGILLVLFMIRFAPETKGRTLEEIEKSIQRKK